MGLKSINVRSITIQICSSIFKQFTWLQNEKNLKDQLYYVFNFRSPLGELFDHGCDSSIVSFMAIGIFSCFGVSTATASELELFFVAVVVFYAFYFSHWEKYTTNIMYLPWAYDLSQIVSFNIISILKNFSLEILAPCQHFIETKLPIMLLKQIEFNFSPHLILTPSFNNNNY